MNPDRLREGLYLFQGDGFRYGTDAVLLSAFAAEKRFTAALDLCSGSGVIALLLSDENKKAPVTGLEIDASACALFRRSAEYNGLEERLFCIEGDLKNIKAFVTAHSYDLVTANPPYYTPESGSVADGPRGIARSEIMCSLEDVVSAAAYSLKTGGRFCTVNKPERTADLICIMRACGIEPKRLRYVAARPTAAPSLLLLEGIREAKAGITVLPTLFLYDERGEYSKEVKDIYKWEQK